MPVRPLFSFDRQLGASVESGQAKNEAIRADAGVDSKEDETERRPRIARRPQTPTKAEMEDHMTLHAEYRDWCPHCLSGRGISDQHRSSDGERLWRESVWTTLS